MHKSHDHHKAVVFRILGYLKDRIYRGISFGRNQHLDLLVYIDVDWVVDGDGLKSTSKYFTLVGRNIVTWRSKKHKVVSLSNTKAYF